MTAYTEQPQPQAFAGSLPVSRMLNTPLRRCSAAQDPGGPQAKHPQYQPPPPQPAPRHPASQEERQVMRALLGVLIQIVALSKQPTYSSRTIHPSAAQDYLKKFTTCEYSNSRHTLHLLVETRITCRFTRDHGGCSVQAVIVPILTDCKTFQRILGR
jgi:hypothetical protein